MALSIPTPRHGWRVFAGEVGTIVLGVLISLALGQVAATTVARADARELVGSMRSELALDRARWQINHDDMRCLDAYVGAVLDRGTTALPDYPHNSFWTIHSSAWQMARDNPALTELPLSERDTFSELYAVMENKDREFAQIDRTMNALVARVAGNGDAREIRVAARLAKLELDNQMSENASIVARFDKLGIEADRDFLATPGNGAPACPFALPPRS